MREMKRKSLILVLTLAMVFTTFSGFAAPAYADGAEDIAKLIITPVDSSGAAIAEPIPAGKEYVFYYKFEIEPSIDIVTVFQFTVEAPTGVELASTLTNAPYGDGYWRNRAELDYDKEDRPGGFYGEFEYEPSTGVFIAYKKDATNLLNTKKTLMTIKATIANPEEGQTYALNITNAMAANDPTGDAGEGNLAVDQTDLKVAKDPVDIASANVTVSGTYTYNGNPIVPGVDNVEVKVGSDTLQHDRDYTYEATNNTNAGIATLTVTGKGEYTGTKTATFEIDKAAAPTGVKAEYSVRFSDTSVQQVRVTDFTGLGGITDPVIDEIDGSINDANNLIASYDKDSFKLKDGLTEAAADKTASWTVFIGSTNHHYINANVIVTAIAKEEVTVDLSDIVLEDKVYDSQKISYTGAAKAVGKDGLAFNYSWYKGSTKLDSPPVHVGDYRLVVEVDSADYYGVAEKSVEITPKQLTISGLKATDRDYDGTNQVDLTGALSGVIEGDIVSLNLGKGTIADANAGNNKGVNLSPALDGANKDNYTLAVTASATVNIAKKAIGIANATIASKVFDNTPAAAVNSVAFTGLVGSEALTKDSDYSATGAFSDVNAGSGKNVDVTVTLKNTDKANNYILINSPYRVSTGEITKAAAPAGVEANYSVRYDDTLGQTVSVNDFAGLGNITNPTLAALGGSADPDGLLQVISYTGFRLKENLTQDSAGKTASFEIKISSTNHEDITGLVKITLTDKMVPTVTVDDIEVTYTGSPLSNDVVEGTATFDGLPVNGSFSWVTDPNGLINAGTYNPDVKFIPEDNANYSEVIKTITVKVNKATPTGAPDFTKISSAGKTLNDANLDVGSIAPAGTIKWLESASTEVVANKSYEWEFTPSDTSNYNNLTGVAKVWTKSSGGSGTSKTPATVPPIVPEEDAAKWENPFIDIQENDWFYSDVQYAYENALMAGTSANTFNPGAATTRGMIVAILHRIEGKPLAGENQFTDVNPSKYYADAVNWAAENNIVSGYGNGLFKPDDSITREQIAVILMNYAKSKGYNTNARADISVYSDAGKVSGWATDAMAWANAEGLIQGNGDYLMPEGEATRAQVAAILNRLIENISK